MTSQRRKSPGRGATAHIQGQNRWKLQQLAAQQRQEQERLKRRQQPVRGEEQKRKVGGHGSISKAMTQEWSHQYLVAILTMGKMSGSVIFTRQNSSVFGSWKRNGPRRGP